MAKDAMIRARMALQLKQEVEQIFEKLGLTTTGAITLFYNQVKLRKGIPFDIALPDKTTRKIFEETDKKSAARIRRK